MPKVAIIGGGPAGLVSARYLKSEGFEPVIFERGRSVGGQWSGDPRCSGVWPSMRTNTTRVMTAFSDFPHPSGTAVYPTNQGMLAYLIHYAEAHGLMSGVRTETRVERVRRGEGGQWIIESRTADGPVVREMFTHVVLATGRYQKPTMPEVPGLASFSGRGEAIHTNAYKDPDSFKGMRVLVAGCAISALEVASDLAMLGAARVITANRRQRYIMPKLCGGIPTDHAAFSRFSALAAEYLPADAVANAFKAFVLKTGGNPEQFGAPRPVENVMQAGVSMCQHYLPLVAEGRIEVKPWIRGVDGQLVTFEDGTEAEVDALICGTGYAFDWQLLDDEVRATLDADAEHVDLHKFTFHPDLPGLALVGLFHQVGPLLPALEQQARWVAYAWSGARPMPTEAVLRSGVDACRARRHLPQLVPMHTTVRIFAGEAGVEPDLREWPDLARPLLFGPIVPTSFRLGGRDSLPNARERFLHDVAEFGVVPSLQLLPEQCAQLQTLAAARRDLDFAAFVGSVTAKSGTA